MIAELRHRDPLLFRIGAAMMLALVVCVLLSIGDQRLILGINPWIKPMKFLISTTIFLWTVAWFMPETRPDGRARKIVRWTIGPAMLIEISLILLQSARGTTSHFNIRSPLDGIIFSVMGSRSSSTPSRCCCSCGSFAAIRRRTAPATCGACASAWRCSCWPASRAR